MNLMLADPPYRIRSARGQASPAHDVFFKEDIEDAVTFMSSLMAPRAQGHIRGSDLVSLYWQKSLRLQTEIVTDVEPGPQGLKEWLPRDFEQEKQALVKMNTARMYDRDARCRELSHAFMLEMATAF